MKSFDCHFQFNTIVQTHGRNEEGATENIENFLNQETIHMAENIIGCGIDFDRDSIEVKEVENGWFELNLLWSGYWSIDKENETKARNVSIEILNERLTPFYQMLENISTKLRRFQFNELKNEQVTDIVEY